MTQDYVAVPKGIAKRHKNVTLSIDLMFIQKQIMLVMVAHYIKFTTIGYIKSRTVTAIFAEIKRVTDIYKQHGFRVTEIRADPEFDPLQPEFTTLGIYYNQIATSEHVPEVECQI